MESFVIDRQGSLRDGEQSATRLLLASANSLKAMIQPSILQNGTFKNPICVARFRGRTSLSRWKRRCRRCDNHVSLDSLRCLNMKCHEIYMRASWSNEKKSIYFSRISCTARHYLDSYGVPIAMKVYRMHACLQGAKFFRVCGAQSISLVILARLRRLWGSRVRPAGWIRDIYFAASPSPWRIIKMYAAKSRFPPRSSA